MQGTSFEQYEQRSRDGRMRPSRRPEMLAAAQDRK